MWSMIVLIGAILAGGGAGVASARAIARTEAEQVVAPVQTSLQIHLSEMLGKQAIMASFVEEERSARCAQSRNVYLLCMQARVRCEPVSANCGSR